MADFTIKQSTGSPSVPTIPAASGMYTGTGYEAINNVLRYAGIKLEETGGKLFEINADSQVIQTMIEIDERRNLLEQELLSENDPQVHAEKYNEFIEGIKQTKLSTALAQRKFDRGLPLYLRSVSNDAYRSFNNQIRENSETAIANLTAQYIQGNASKEALEAELKNHANTFGRKDDWVDFHLGKADKELDKHLTAQQYKDGRMWVGEHPEEAYSIFIDAIDTGKVPENYKGPPIDKLDDGHWRAFKNIAFNDIRENRKKKLEHLDVIGEKMDDFAWKMTSTNEVIDYLEADGSLTAEEQIAALDRFNDSLAIRLKADKKPDAQEFEKEAAVQNVLYKYIDGISAREVGVEIPEDTRVFVKEYALRVFEDAIKTKKLTDENEKRKEAIKIGMNIKELLADGYFENVFPEKLPLPTKPKGPLHGKLKAGQFIPPASLGKQLGLGKIWEQMNDIEKITAVSAREKNVSAKDLIDEFNRNK